MPFKRDKPMLRRIQSRLRWYLLRIKVFLGIPIPLHAYYEDRIIFEEQILPYFRSESRFNRILFVGCESYTAHYKHLFSKKEYWTLEVDPTKRVFGSRNHVTDTIANLERHFQPGSLDLIMMNGIFGWGLNDRDEAERSIDACHRSLAPGGVLFIGWDDTPEYRPFAPDDLQTLAKFSPFVFPPFGESVRLVPGELRHTFNFYQKPAEGLSDRGGAFV